MKLNDEQVAEIWTEYTDGVRNDPDLVTELTFEELVFEIEVDLGIEIERDNLGWKPQKVRELTTE